MSVLTIRRRLRRRRSRLTVIAAVLATAAVIAAHHSDVFTGVDHDVGMAAAVEMCLGVFTAVGAALVAAGVAVAVLGPRRWTPRDPTRGASAVAVVAAARARHGPRAVSVLCVSRR